MNLRFVQWDFPGAPVAKDPSLTLHFHCREPGFHPWSGSLDPACWAVWPKNKNIKTWRLYLKEKKKKDLYSLPVPTREIVNGDLCVYALRFWVQGSFNPRSLTSDGVSVAHLWMSPVLVQKSGVVSEVACTFCGNSARRSAQVWVHCMPRRKGGIGACLAFFKPEDC